MLDSAYTRGYANMIKGHYDSALDFLKLAEIEYLKLTDQSEDKEWNNRMKLELYFSLAVCYLNSAVLWFNNLYKYLSNKKLPRILSCWKFHLP